MRDVFYLDSLGKDNGPVAPSVSLRNVTLNIFILLRVSSLVKFSVTVSPLVLVSLGTLFDFQKNNLLNNNSVYLVKK